MLRIRRAPKAKARARARAQGQNPFDGAEPLWKYRPRRLAQAGILSPPCTQAKEDDRMKAPDFPSPSIWHAHRVSYGETDTMGYLYYGEYLHVFERARSAYFRTIGMSYNEVEAKGFLLPVREASLRYRRPSRYDDLLYTRCAVSELSRASLTFVYGIYAEDREELRVTGFTQHALTDRQGRPVRMPDWLKDCVARVPDGEVVLV